MRENDLTDAEFARQVPCGRSLVGRWRRGTAIPNAHYCRRIAELTQFRLTANSFIHANQQPVPPNGYDQGQLQVPAGAASPAGHFLEPAMAGGGHG